MFFLDPQTNFLIFMRRLFPPSLNILSSQCTGLNLATVMMHQPTVDSSKTVCNRVRMWQVCPAGKGLSDSVKRFGTKKKYRNSCWKWKEKNKRWGIDFISARINTPSEKDSTSRNPISSLFCFFCSPPLDLFHPLWVLQMEMSFFFFSLSAPLSSALRDKCYYLIILL